MTVQAPSATRPAFLRPAAPSSTQAQRSILGFLEYLFVVVTLILCLNGFREVFTSDSADSSVATLTDANFSFQLFSGTLYLIAVAFILADFSRFIHLCLRNWALLLMLAIIVMSSAWSVYPMVSFRRASALLLTTGFAAYFAMRFTPQTALKLVALACGISAVASLVLVVVDPSAAIHPDGDIHAGDWRGVFGMKNVMGRSMAFGVLTLLATMFVVRPAAKLLTFAGIVLCAGLLIMSAARTGWVVAFFVLFAAPFFVILQPNRFSRAVRICMVGLAVIAGCVLVAMTFQYGLALIGRDETLSGRTHLWDLALASGKKRFLIGAGYRAYWTASGASDIYTQTSLGGRSLGNGHNGYLDTWLELGMMGFSAFLLLLVTVIVRITRHLTRSADAIGLWLAMAVSYMALYAFTEQVLMQQSEITWVMTVATLFWLTPLRAATGRRVQWRPASGPQQATAATDPAAPAGGRYSAGGRVPPRIGYGGGQGAVPRRPA
jgi:exopolysaccharide production protein ExoQ